MVREDLAGWEECKTSEDLEKLAIKSPNRYCRDSEGRWCCPPGQAFALATGLYYRVRSSEEINWVLQRNLQVPAQSHGDAFQHLAAASEQDLKIANVRFDLVKRHMEDSARSGALAVGFPTDLSVTCPDP